MANFPGTTLEPPTGNVVAQGLIEGRGYWIFSDGKVVYENLTGAKVVFEDEAKFRACVGVPDKAAEANSRAGTHMAIGGLIFGASTAITLLTLAAAQGGGRYVVVWGAMLFGICQFFYGLSQRVSS